MKKRNQIIFVVVSLLVTAVVLFLINYLAIANYMGNLGLFTVLILFVPLLCIAVVSFMIGYRIQWKWRSGSCISLILVLMSWGVSELATAMVGDSLNITAADELPDAVQNSTDEIQMEELYDELDQKAYEYMLEQGLIAEGEEIYSGDNVVGENNTDGYAIESTEMYIGIQKSDAVSELMGNLLTFLVACGLSFVGYKMQNRHKSS